MVQQSRQEYLRAIELAQQEANDLMEQLKKFQKLQQRLIQLSTFIEQGKLILGIESLDTLKPTSSPGKKKGLGLIYPEDLEEQPIYLKVVQILRETGISMTLSDLAEEFRKRNWKLSKKNARQVLRNTMKAKPEMFLKKGLGEGGKVLYGLKEESSDK